MPNAYDAGIKLVYVADPDPAPARFTIDDVSLGAEFKVVADVEVGSAMHALVTKYDMVVGVVNLTRCQSVTVVKDGASISPDNSGVALRKIIEVTIPSGWANALEGDVLQVVASFKLTAGAVFDYSAAISPTFVVS
ncbi:MAG: hypothetical protein GXX79_21150 [Actinomycetales bacterium]|nr:hypothetical protein [Actinomycetales bacterium]